MLPCLHMPVVIFLPSLNPDGNNSVCHPKRRSLVSFALRFVTASMTIFAAPSVHLSDFLSPSSSRSSLDSIDDRTESLSSMIFSMEFDDTISSSSAEASVILFISSVSMEAFPRKPASFVKERKYLFIIPCKCRPIISLPDVIGCFYEWVVIFNSYYD